ncbi:MAG: hypothetical protein OXC26_02060 [Albidovulum sp.]|nr:hypothetical protein [Albidovulum sp.]
MPLDPADFGGSLNALIMGTGGHSVVDFMRAGEFMSILFLVVSLGLLNLLY